MEKLTVDTVSSVPHLIDIDMFRESISKMKNGKTPRPPGVVSEAVKAVEEAEVYMITDLVKRL